MMPEQDLFSVLSQSKINKNKDNLYSTSTNGFVSDVALIRV